MSSLDSTASRDRRPPFSDLRRLTSGRRGGGDENIAATARTSDDGDIGATSWKELGTRFPISRALRVLVSVVVIIVIGTVAP